MRRFMIPVAALLALAGCGGNDPAPAEDEAPATTAPSTTLISVKAETTSGLIGSNFDDEVCVLGEPEYELRDGTGEIIDVGRWEYEGASVGESRWAAGGTIESMDPYQCVLSEQITAPASDIYVLTVTVMELSFGDGGLTASGEATFRRDQASDVTVRIEGSG